MKKDSAMMPTVRLFIFVEAVSYVVAALVHFGVLFTGYEHQEARLAESVLAIVLFGGLALTFHRPAWTLRVGIDVQGFALLRTLVGVFTIVVGVGPRTAPDVIYQICIMAALIVLKIVAFIIQPMPISPL